MVKDNKQAIKVKEMATLKRLREQIFAFYQDADPEKLRGGLDVNGIAKWTIDNGETQLNGLLMLQYQKTIDFSKPPEAEEQQVEIFEEMYAPDTQNNKEAAETMDRQTVKRLELRRKLEAFYEEVDPEVNEEAIEDFVDIGLLHGEERLNESLIEKYGEGFLEEESEEEEEGFDFDELKVKQELRIFYKKHDQVYLESADQIDQVVELMRQIGKDAVYDKLKGFYDESVEDVVAAHKEAKVDSITRGASFRNSKIRPFDDIDEMRGNLIKYYKKHDPEEVENVDDVIALGMDIGFPNLNENMEALYGESLIVFLKGLLQRPKKSKLRMLHESRKLGGSKKNIQKSKQQPQMVEVETKPNPYSKRKQDNGHPEVKQIVNYDDRTMFEGQKTSKADKMKTPMMLNPPSIQSQNLSKKKQEHLPPAIPRKKQMVEEEVPDFSSSNYESRRKLHQERAVPPPPVDMNERNLPPTPRREERPVPVPPREERIQTPPREQYRAQTPPRVERRVPTPPRQEMRVQTPPRAEPRRTPPTPPTVMIKLAQEANPQESDEVSAEELLSFYEKHDAEKLKLIKKIKKVAKKIGRKKLNEKLMGFYGADLNTYKPQQPMKSMLTAAPSTFTVTQPTERKVASRQVKSNYGSAKITVPYEDLDQLRADLVVYYKSCDPMKLNDLEAIIQLGKRLGRKVLAGKLEAIYGVNLDVISGRNNTSVHKQDIPTAYAAAPSPPPRTNEPKYESPAEPPGYQRKPDAPPRYKDMGISPLPNTPSGYEQVERVQHTYNPKPMFAERQTSARAQENIERLKGKGVAVVPIMASPFDIGSIQLKSTGRDVTRTLNRKDHKTKKDMNLMYRLPKKKKKRYTAASMKLLSVNLKASSTKVGDKGKGAFDDYQPKKREPKVSVNNLFEGHRSRKPNLADGPCDRYKLDMSSNGSVLGVCTCGYPKAKHQQSFRV